MKSKRVLMGHGQPCPKCTSLMSRYEHSQEWLPRKRQPYYYLFWDYCKECRHVQHYETAKQIVKQDQKNDFELR
jgi:hypothetical protein